MKNKFLVLLLVLLSVAATSAGTITQRLYGNGQTIGLIFASAFLVAAIIAGAWRSPKQ